MICEILKCLAITIFGVIINAILVSAGKDSGEDFEDLHKEM